MLGTLLDRLGTLISKYFVIASLVPVLMFAFLNGGLLFWNVPSFRRFGAFLFSSPESSAYSSAGAAAGLAVAAYILSSATTFMREVLEGKRWKALLPASLFESRQWEKRRLLHKRHEGAKIARLKIQQNREAWRSTLTSAIAQRNDSQPILSYKEETTAWQRVERLGARVIRGQDCKVEYIDKAVKALAKELKKQINPQGEERNKVEGKSDLERDHNLLLIYIDDALDHYGAKEVYEFNQKLFLFGDADVAPTAMGNVALSIESYAYSRYGLNLTHFWSRFQPVLQTNKDFYSGLLDAKTQVEFLVGCSWLSALTALVWSILLSFKSFSVSHFLVVALAGPLLTVMFYRLAVTSYIVFADLVRTGVDLYRLELLASLHVSPPGSLREERTKWNALGRVSAVGQHEQELSYQLKADT